jgi:hypothetical protein
VHHGFNPFDSTAVNIDSSVFKEPLSYQYPGADFTNQFTATDSSFSYNLGYSSKEKQILSP